MLNPSWDSSQWPNIRKLKNWKKNSTFQTAYLKISSTNWHVGSCRFDRQVARQAPIFWPPGGEVGPDLFNLTMRWQGRQLGFNRQMAIGFTQWNLKPGVSFKRHRCKTGFSSFGSLLMNRHLHCYQLITTLKYERMAYPLEDDNHPSSLILA